MRIYIRKLFPHDITHEVSVTTDIVNSFFDSSDSFYMKGLKSGYGGKVTINAATDPRFGGVFKSILEKEGTVSVDDLFIVYKEASSYVLEVIKKFDERYNSFFGLFKNKDRHVIAEFDAFEEESGSEKLEQGSVVTADNIILYGVPGCGKSHYIKSNFCDNELYMEKIVFHPDYTYSDFVGQILPQNISGSISYPFIPGPFTRILKKAVEDDSNNYYLIIEEINRGNAPAIFGEIFQLLDRTNGISDYGINNTDIANAVYGDEHHLIKIPANMYIVATMNTADQNVFTLDTAFKRRWKMKSIPNDISKCIFAAKKICGTTITWGRFMSAINQCIIESNEDGIGSEDKRLGAYFVRPDELEDKELFAEKVLLYLWNDAFKFNRDKVFKPEFKTLDALLDGYYLNGLDVFADTLGFSESKETI